MLARTTKAIKVRQARKTITLEYAYTVKGKNILFFMEMKFMFVVARYRSVQFDAITIAIAIAFA